MGIKGRKPSEDIVIEQFLEFGNHDNIIPNWFVGFVCFLISSIHSMVY